jgi:hypothetical protein
MLLPSLLVAAQLFVMNSDPARDHMDIRVEETRRTARTSFVRINVMKVGASVGSSMFVYGALLRLARQRHFPYFVKTAERDLEFGRLSEMEIRFYRRKPNLPDVFDVNRACSVMRCD